MQFDEALDQLAGDPHAWRFRELCQEENPDAEQRDAYRDLVVRLASGDAVGSPPRSPTPPVDYGATPTLAPCCGGS